MSGQPKPCPHCGTAAHRITPMGFWSPSGGYSPSGVRYVCGALYENPPRSCPGTDTFYGENAEAEALAGWDTRTEESAR